LATEAAGTRGSLLARATLRLREAGVAEPRREALRILADHLGESPGAVLADKAAPIEPADLARLEQLVSRRAAGEPLPYVTGVAGFRRLALRCDHRALIPRPETEGLVDLVLERCTGGTIADIGTGSGCLALALADEGSFSLVVAVDRSREALGLARENVALTALGVTLVRGDLTSAFGDSSLDAVVSNPPYLATGEYESLDPSVRAWEPAAALVSGEDGLEATRRLLADARRAVGAGGWIALEVDASRAGETARCARASGWEAVDIHEDLYGRERYLLARRSDGR
jgi:release factor glutamine methyltransferase